MDIPIAEFEVRLLFFFLILSKLFVFISFFTPSVPNMEGHNLNTLYRPGSLKTRTPPRVYSPSGVAYIPGDRQTVVSKLPNNNNNKVHRRRRRRPSSVRQQNQETSGRSLRVCARSLLKAVSFLFLNLVTLWRG
jgi:hypothetical protein